MQEEDVEGISTGTPGASSPHSARSWQAGLSSVNGQVFDPGNGSPVGNEPAGSPVPVHISEVTDPCVLARFPCPVVGNAGPPFG